MLSLGKKYYIFLILFLSFVLCEGRGQNLIKNGGFENYISPPDWNTTGGGFFDYSFFPEHRIVLDWDVFNTSPDYYNVVCPVQSVPFNNIGNAYAKNGNAYAGIITYVKTLESKEYFNQHLASPLIADSVYCLSFFVSRSDRTTYSIKNIGATFSSTLASMSSSVYIAANPQIVNTNGFLTDTIGWTEIQGCFTAQGGEQYITIGNFNSNANTDTLFVGSTNPHPGANGYAYYYIDSLSLWQNNFPTGINETSEENSFVVYPNPANDLLNFQFYDADEKRKVELYDAIGNLVLSKNASADKLSLTTCNLSNGIYYYRISVKGIIVNTNKVVIIK